MPQPTLTSDNYRHGFVRQPLWQLIEVANYVLADPIRAVFTVTFNNTASPTQTIEVTWNGNTVTMEADPSPDDSGTQFATGSDNDDQADKFAEGCLANYYYARDYEITVLANVVTFTARQGGDEYAPTDPVITPGSLADLTETATGDDGVVQDNYSIGLRICIEEEWKSDEWTMLPEMYKIPVGVDEDAEVKFNLSPQLRAFCAPFFPDFGLSDGPVRAEGLQRRYFFEYFEIYGETPTPKAVQRLGDADTPKTCWFGGLQRRDRGDAIAFAEECTGTNPSKAHYFHTWRGRASQRRVSKTEPVYLNWYKWNISEEGEDPDL